MPLLEKKTTAVRTTMLLVNKLVRPGDTEEEDTADQLTRLLKNLSWLTERPSGMAHLRRVEKFKKHRATLSQDDAFRLLMDLLQLEMSDEEE